ncbi:MAG: YraN family protein [Myxococcaceae bacterium]|nr:YraN family protein [Myxococcaceae bacterium]
MPREQRREPDRRAFGGEAETLAVEHLERSGYHIRDRNVPCRLGELDVVAEKDGLLVIVEVRMKSNAAMGEPSETVMFQKQKRVVLATLYDLQGERLHDVAVRFDVISVVGRGRAATVEHIENAFDAGF